MLKIISDPDDSRIFFSEFVKNSGHRSTLIAFPPNVYCNKYGEKPNLKINLTFKGDF